MFNVLTRNRCRCLVCGDIIESTSGHDFRYCSCRSIFTDGGLEYVRRGGDDLALIEDLSEYRPKTVEELEAELNRRLDANAKYGKLYSEEYIGEFVNQIEKQKGTEMYGVFKDQIEASIDVGLTPIDNVVFFYMVERFEKIDLMKALGPAGCFEVSEKYEFVKMSDCVPIFKEKAAE